MEILKNYISSSTLRKKSTGLGPRPLNENDVNEIFELLNTAKKDITISFLDNEYQLSSFLINLLKNEVLRGTFPESYKKAAGLYEIVNNSKKSIFLSAKDSLDLLLDMKGGAATPYLIKLINENLFKEDILNYLKNIVLVNKEDFDELTKLSKSDELIKNLIVSWAEKEFSNNYKIDYDLSGLAIKVGDFISTDHLSPGKHANSRTDKPLHATYIMQGRPEESEFMNRLNNLKSKNPSVFIVGGEGFGEGSSRKSATYTVLQVIGNDISGEPENKSGGVVIAKSMAPIFRNSLVSSAVLPILCDTSSIKETDNIKIDIENSKIIVNDKNEIEFQNISNLDMEKIVSGGVNNYSAGKELQSWAVEYCINNNINFNQEKMPEKLEKESKTVPMNLAQKIVAFNRIDGKDTVESKEMATVKVRGVFSQDTTGPMTMEEYQSMAGGMTFGSEFVIQSLCHTCEAPTSEERDRQKFLVNFVKDRGGVGLRAGEGVIHTIGNRFSLPTDIIVGGDSHTRTPRGISFPGASDIVASCMKYGKMDLVMDDVVKVEFEGELQPGLTARDMVSMLVTEADKQGFGKGIYTGTVIEMYGVSHLSAEEKYILTNAAAERSASAGIIPTDESTINEIKSDLEYLKSRSDAKISPSVINTIKSFENYLANPIFLKPDENAKYKAVIKIDMSTYKEPLIAKPHHPDNVVTLSEISGIKVDEVYIGSCVGGEFESISTAAKVIKGKTSKPDVNFVISPAAEFVTKQLNESGDIDLFIDADGVVIMPTCGLCMGNKRRIGSGSTAITTTTRNYQGRLGPANSGSYLGSSLVASCCAILGQFPTVKEYFELIKNK